MGSIKVIRVRTLATVLLFLFCLLGCETQNSVDGDTDGQAPESDSAEPDTTERADTDSCSDTDSESDLETGEDDAACSEDDVPEPAEPCAPVPDCDLDTGCDVNQVTGTVCPSIGEVEEAEPYLANLEEDGEFDVFTKSVKIPIKKGTLNAAGYEINVESGTLSGTVYAPSEDRGKTIAPGTFPLVIVLAGFQVSYTWYGHYSKHFASHGFAVLGVKTRSELAKASHDKEAFEIKQTLDWMENADTPLAGQLDLSKVAIAAHSKGGKLAFFAAAIDERVDIVIGWDPNNNGGPPCTLNIGECNAFPVAPNCEENDPGVEHLMQAETLVLGMPRDGLNPDGHHNSIHFYRGAPSPAALVYYDAGHLASIFNQDVIKLNKTVQVALLLTRFKGVPNLGEYLPRNPEGAANIRKNSFVSRVECK